MRGNAIAACGSAIKATQLMLRCVGLCAHSRANSQNSLRACRKPLRCFVPRHVCVGCACSLCARLTAHLAAQPAIATASEQRAHSRVVTRHIRLRSGVWQRAHGPSTAAATSVWPTSGSTPRCVDTALHDGLPCVATGRVGSRLAASSGPLTTVAIHVSTAAKPR